MEVNFNTLPDQAKVWMYQASRPFTEADKKVIYNLSEVFLSQWESHNIPVQGSVDVLNDLFIRIAAFTDEPSMCGRAQDAQVRLAKELEQELDLQLTNRMLLAFEIEKEIKVVHLDDVPGLVSEGLISNESTFFNNLITSKEEFNKDWMTKASRTWLSRYF